MPRNPGSPRSGGGFRVSRWDGAEQRVKYRTVRMKRASLVIGVLASTNMLNAQATLYPEKLRADIEVLRAAIHSAHPDPYRYITRGELDALFDSVRDSITEPLTTDRFQLRMLSVLHRIGDSRLRLEPDTADMKERMASATLPPFEVKVLDEGLYIAEELKGFRSFAPGSRIVSVNGISSARLLRDLGAWVVCDGSSQACRAHAIEDRFLELFLLTYGHAAKYVVEVEGPDGGIREEVVTGLRVDEMNRTRKPSGLSLHPWRTTWEPESATLWATFTTLEPAALEASGQRPRAFVEAMLKELRSLDARVLVIDLRGTGGTELGMAEVLFAAIARAPFRVLQGITVRAGQSHALPGLAELPDDYLVSLDRNYLPVRNGVHALRPDDPRLTPVQPARHAFGGKVYVVCDGGTRDAAAAFAMLAKRSSRARLVGHEVGANAHSFTGGRTITVLAPNTGLRLQVPLLRYIPDGSTDAPADRGESPHHVVSQQPWGIATGRDAVRSALLEMIRELN